MLPSIAPQFLNKQDTTPVQISRNNAMEVMAISSELPVTRGLPKSFSSLKERPGLSSPRNQVARAVTKPNTFSAAQTAEKSFEIARNKCLQSLKEEREVAPIGNGNNKAKLEAFLTVRAPVTELIQNNILKEEVALEKTNETAKSLNHFLEVRPAEKDLLSHNIIHFPTSVAPEMVSKMLSLQRHARKSSLSSFLQNRPNLVMESNLENLINETVLSTTGYSEDSLFESARPRTLTDTSTSSEFEPNVSELVSRRIFKRASVVASKPASDISDNSARESTNTLATTVRFDTLPSKDTKHYLYAVNKSETLDRSFIISQKLSVNCVVMGRNHSFILTVDGILYGSGNNEYGQLGLGHTNPVSGFSKLQTGHQTRIVSAAAGLNHSGFINDLGKVYMFGSNESSMLGVLQSNKSCISTPTYVEEFRNIEISSLALGDRHSIAISLSGDLYSWGFGDEGVLGVENPPDILTKPTLLSEFREFFDLIACGSDHVIARSFDGNVYSWGCNKNGQLGLTQANVIQFTPKLVMSLWRQGIVSLHASEVGSVALSRAGDVYATSVMQESVLLRDFSSAKFYRLTPSNSFSAITAVSSRVYGCTSDGEIYSWDVSVSSSTKKSTIAPTKSNLLKGCVPNHMTSNSSCVAVIGSMCNNHCRLVGNSK